MPLLCKGPRSGPFAQQRTTTATACFYSATLAWNATAIDTGACAVGTAVTVSRAPTDSWMLHVSVEQCQTDDIVVAAPNPFSDAG